MKADIDWVINSPLLINPQAGLTSFKELISINDSCLSSENNTNFLARNLGGYYENIVSFIINKDRYLSDIKRNIKVYNGKVTQGEFDFIGRSKDGDFHLECAIKFYLRTGTGTSLKDFIGPGKRDRLDIKFERMADHQLKLSTTSQGIQACKQEGLSPSLFIMLMQGYLFHPYDEFNIEIPLHSAINRNHEKGWWLRKDEIRKLKGLDRYTIMHKPYWLTADSSRPLNYDQLEVELLNSDRPMLVARFDKKGKEIDRGFIVPNGW